MAQKQKQQKQRKPVKPKPEPLFFKYQGFGNKTRKLYPLESNTHLQAVVNYTLPDGREIGALLLDSSRDPDRPDHKMRFIWECEGIHDDFTAGEANAIVRSIAALNQELPIGESLRIEMHSFANYDEREAELIRMFENSENPASQQLLAEEIKVLQDLDASNQRRPKSIYLMGTYTPSSYSKRQDLLSKFIAWLEVIFTTLSGTRAAKQQQTIDILLLKAHDGYLRWCDLFRDKLQLRVRPLTGEQVWQHSWQELNRFNARALEIDPPLAPQLIQFNLKTCQIGETIRTKLHPTSVMMASPSAVPSANREYVAVDGKYVNGLVLRTQPEGFDANDVKSDRQMQLYYLWGLLNKSAMRDSKIVLEVSRPEDEAARYNNQQMIRQEHFRQKDMQKKGRIDVGSEVALEGAIEAERNFVAGKSITEFALTIFTYRDTLEEMHAASREIASYFISPATMLPEVDTMDALWASSLPFYGKSMLVDVRDRRDREHPDYVASYYPVVRTISPHRTGIEFIAVSGGSPICIDPFRNPGHIALWGKTRSGKSLLAAYIIHLALSLGIVVTIMDMPPTKEASTFKDFTINMGGAYIDAFSDSLNFFETPEIPLELDSETRNDAIVQYKESIVQILRTMVLGAKGELPNVSSAKVTSLLTKALNRFFLNERIKRRYERARQGGIGSPDWKLYPILQDYIEFCNVEHLDLQEPTDDDIDTLSVIRLQLEKWAEGAYAKVLNAPSNVPLDRPLLALALRDVSSNDDAAVFGSITYAAAMRRSIAAAHKNGSLVFSDECSITCKLDPISLALGRIAANGLKAGIRLMIAGQEPPSIYNSAGGSQIKAAISYHIIGRIGSIAEFCAPDMLRLPEDLAEVNAKKEFLPDKATCSSQWLLLVDDRFTAARIFLPPSLVALTANNIDERQAREARKQAERQAQADRDRELINN